VLPLAKKVAGHQRFRVAEANVSTARTIAGARGFRLDLGTIGLVGRRRSRSVASTGPAEPERRRASRRTAVVVSLRGIGPSSGRGDVHRYEVTHGAVFGPGNRRGRTLAVLYLGESRVPAACGELLQRAAYGPLRSTNIPDPQAWPAITGVNPAATASSTSASALNTAMR
jgi:hypothetical protein